ncbi:putative plus-end-directed kinesin ATPase [Helianthus anomalus]
MNVDERARTSELVEAVLQGRNGPVFYYGATGAGKTFTMLGTVEYPGVMVLSIKDLFNKVKKNCDGNHVVHLSYLEVYNETVRDLLSPVRPLILREDKQVYISFYSLNLCWRSFYKDFANFIWFHMGSWQQGLLSIARIQRMRYFF